MALNVAVRNEQLTRLAQTIGARHGLSCAFFNASEGPYDPNLGAPVGTFSTSCPGRDLSPTTQRFEAARMEFERARSQVEAGLAGDPRAALTPLPQAPTFVPTPSAAYPVYAPPVIPSGPPVPQVPVYAPPEMRPAELPRPERRTWEPVPIARPEARPAPPRPAVPAIDRGWTMHEMWIDISDTAWYPGRGPDFIPMTEVLLYGAGSGPRLAPGGDQEEDPLLDLRVALDEIEAAYGSEKTKRAIKKAKKAIGKLNRAGRSAEAREAIEKAAGSRPDTANQVKKLKQYTEKGDFREQLVERMQDLVRRMLSDKPGGMDDAEFLEWAYEAWPADMLDDPRLELLDEGYKKDMLDAEGGVLQVREATDRAGRVAGNKRVLFAKRRIEERAKKEKEAEEKPGQPPK